MRFSHLTRTRGRYAWAGESMIPNKGRLLISIPVLGWDKGILYLGSGTGTYLVENSHSWPIVDTRKV